MTFETYWLVVPLIGAGIAWGGALVLWLTRSQDKTHKAAAE
jgi:hypothetical protein